MKTLSDCAQEIRERYSLKALSVFGSVVRAQAADDSDVDVIVAFKQNATFDLFMYLKFYLEELLETDVDLVTDKALRPQLRRATEQEIIHIA